MATEVQFTPRDLAYLRELDAAFWGRKQQPAAAAEHPVSAHRHTPIAQMALLRASNAQLADQVAGLHRLNILLVALASAALIAAFCFGFGWWLSVPANFTPSFSTK